MFLCPAQKAQDDIEIIYTTYNIFLRGVQVSWESKLRQNKLKVAFQWTLNQSGFLIHVKWFVEMKDLWKTEPDLGLLQHPRWSVPAVKYYHKALHLGCCSSPRSASERYMISDIRTQYPISNFSFKCRLPNLHKYLDFSINSFKKTA